MQGLKRLWYRAQVLVRGKMKDRQVLCPFCGKVLHVYWSRLWWPENYAIDKHVRNDECRA